MTNNSEKTRGRYQVVVAIITGIFLIIATIITVTQKDDSSNSSNTPDVIAKPEIEVEDNSGTIINKPGTIIINQPKDDNLLCKNQKIQIDSFLTKLESISYNLSFNKKKDRDIIFYKDALSEYSKYSCKMLERKEEEIKKVIKDVIELLQN